MIVMSVVTRFNKFLCNGLPYFAAFPRSSVNQVLRKKCHINKIIENTGTCLYLNVWPSPLRFMYHFYDFFANFCLLFDSLVIPSVSLSAMNVLLLASSSGLVTTMEVSGVTKLYFNERLKASAVAFPFSSGVPLSLLENIFVLLDLIQIFSLKD